jgi:TetR/AcrR family transcriptional repressor of nem operon
MVQQARAEDKFKSLVDAGAKVVHLRSFQGTKLSDVAEEAGVPPGGLYYYFKTRNELAKAIVEERSERILRLTTKLSRLRGGPRKRLAALVDVWVDDREIDSVYGCPIGSLCYELAKGRTELSRGAEKPFNILIDWAEKQFVDLKLQQKKARDYAVHLISALQGISLVSNVYGDSSMILREASHLKAWLDGM